MRLLVIVAGLCAGIAIAIAALLLRPMQFLAPTPPPDGSDALRFEMVAGQARGMSDGPFAALGAGKPLAGGLGEPALDHARFGIAILDGGEQGGRAIGVKLSALKSDNDLLRGRLAASSAWNLVWPAQGSLFLLSEDDLWPQFADSVRRGMTGSGFAPEQRAYLQTARRPRPRVVGASGRLESAAGRFQEKRLPGKTGKMSGEIELQLRSE